MGNCNQFCTHDDPQLQLDKSVKPGHPTSQIVSQQFILKCQICGQDRKHTRFRDHLDLCHFASIQQKSGAASQIVCLLCNYKTNSLQLHRSHLRSSHSYMDLVTKKNLDQQQKDNKIETNQKTKKKITSISKKQFTTNSDSTALVRNQRCNVTSFQKQYGALQFDEDKATGDVVWRYAFGDLRNAIYYYIQFTARQKSIIASSKLFTKAS